MKIFKIRTPEKPKTTKGQIDMMWDALFNALPHRLQWQDVKINFILTFVALILTGMGILLAITLIRG